MAERTTLSEPAAEQRSPSRCPSCGGTVPEGEVCCISQAETLAPSESPGKSKDAPIIEIGKYRVLRELGAGGMGTVYEAFDPELKRKVALKVFPVRLAGSERARARFLREAWIAGKLSHPNLVKVFERGSFESILYYSMELMDGGSLSDVVENLRRWGRDERWGLEYHSREYTVWAISQVVAAARGLDYAHRQGVLHRDIKPMNLLLNRDPVEVKVADFGLAVETDAARMTTTGRVMGSLAYMPPEQARGRREEMDARSDVYSLAVTLFELLTLQLPFKAPTQELYLSAILTTNAERPSRINRALSHDLDNVIGKALEKSPADRYATAEAFADDLENVLNFRPIVARRPNVAVKIYKWARRKPMHAALAGLLILGVPTVAGLTVRSIQHERLATQITIERLWQEARRLNQENRPGDAMEPLSRILDFDPEHVDALKARGINCERLYRNESDPGRREELKRQALEDISQLIAMMPKTAWPYRLRAFLFEQFGQSAEAEADLAAAARYREEPLSVEEIAIEGDMALLKGSPARAAELFSSAIELQPGATSHYLGRAQARRRLGDLQGAIQDYQIMTALAPSDYVPRYQLGRVSILAGDPEAAIQHFRKASEIEPGSALPHAGLADAYLKQAVAKAVQGDAAGAGRLLGEAEASARKAIALDPGHAWAHVNLAVALMERNRLLPETDPALLREAVTRNEEAIAIWREEGGFAQEPAYAAALVNICDTLIQLGDLEKALSACTDVCEALPGEADAFYNVAGVYALLGRTEDAFANLERDFELGDTDHAYLASDEWFVSLRDDPRFEALLDRMREAAGS